MTLLRQTGQATHFKHMTGDDFTPSEWTRTTYCACSRALLTQYAKHWCSWPTIIMKIIILLSHSMLLTYLPLLRAKVFIGQGKQTALPKLTLAKHWCELKIIKYCNCSASIPYYGGEILRQACFLDRKMFRQCSTVILWFVIFMAHSFLPSGFCSNHAAVVLLLSLDSLLWWVYLIVGCLGSMYLVSCTPLVASKIHVSFCCGSFHGVIDFVVFKVLKRTWA